VFSDVTPQDVEGRLMFQYLSGKLGAGKHSVGIIYSAVPYAQAGYEQLKSLALAKGDKLVDQDNYDAAGLSFSAQAQRVAQLNPDGLMLWGAAAPADAQMLAQIRAAGYKGPIVGDVSFSLPFVPGIAKSAASTLVSFSQLNVVDPQGATKQFLAQYKAKYKSQATYLPAAAYDAVHILATAVKKAGCKTDPTSVSKAMIGLTYDGVNGTYNYSTGYKGGPPASSFRPITYKGTTEVFAPPAG
jgi:branched-chain amino acid transport system substrate-binding protein